MRQFVDNPPEINGIRVVQDGIEIYKALITGETVYHWEFGNSMFPILMSGEYCKIRPIMDPHEVNVGDAVFCSFQGKYFMVHRCVDKFERDGIVWFKIATTGDAVYGWTHEVFGIAESTNIFQNGEPVSEEGTDEKEED